MDQELIAYLDERFSEASQQIEGLRVDMMGRLERVEEAVRHTQVSLEGLHGEVRLVAEGVMGVGERLGFLREDISREAKETDGFLRLSYGTMDRHIKDMDQFVRVAISEMNARMRPIEGWQERYGRDPVALIREKYGKKPDPSV